MALPILSLKILKHVLQSFKEEERKLNAVSLGYPDILASKTTLAEIFGEEVGKNVQYHPESEQIMRWHNVSDITDGIPEAYDFFDRLNISLEVVDIVKARGDEIILNLNEDIPGLYKNKYDLLIDAGTMEHCFNVAQAIKNLAEMITVGGYIIQSNPITCMNHGFYNFCPTFYYDFYLENGFEIILFDGIVDAVRNPKTFELPAYSRIRGVPEESNSILIVRKVEQKNITWPIQTKYKRNSTLKA